PRSNFAPACATRAAIELICASDSTAQGPAAIATDVPPTVTPLPRSTIEPSGWKWREASLNGCATRTMSSTPGAASSASSSLRCSLLLPTMPITVRSVPRLKCAWQPHSLIRVTTWFTCSSVASAPMMTIIVRAPYVSRYSLVCFRAENFSRHVRTQNPQIHAQLLQFGNRCFYFRIERRGLQIQIETVFPRSPRNRPALDFHQIDSSARKRSERMEKRSRLVGRLKYERKFVRGVGGF